MTERYKNWRGTAAELAGTATELLESLGFDAQRINERLVRYYVQQGVLERPAREGREAMFGFRQLLEMVVARELADDGWPLAKIAAWIRKADRKALLDLVDNRQLAATGLMRATLSRALPETRRLLLAVNDDPQSDLDLYQWLAARGVAVLRAYSTGQALTLLDRARVHVVLSDLARMEGDMLNKRAGMTLARQVRQRGSDVPIVIYTLDKSEQVKELVVEAGANYVTEREDELRDWLEKLGI